MCSARQESNDVKFTLNQNSFIPDPQHPKMSEWLNSFHREN